jgi:hypothetical protein
MHEKFGTKENKKPKISDSAIRRFGDSAIRHARSEVLTLIKSHFHN